MSTTRLLKLILAAALAGMSAIVIVAMVGLAWYVLLPGEQTGQPPVAEAGGMWFAWLHNPRDDGFLRVYEDGTTESHTLPLSPGERLISSPYAFAPGGELIAACLYNEANNTRDLVVHSFNPDAAAKAGLSYPVRYPLGNRAECSVGQDTFNVSDPNRVAFGVINYFPGDPDADTSLPDWELLIFDAAQGAIVGRYDAHTPGAQDLLPYEGRGFFMPVVHRYEGNTVYFELAPWGTEFLPGQNVVAWEVGSQSVTPVEEPMGRVGLAAHPVTGERVWLAEDANRPAAQPMGPMPPYNVVLYQPAPDVQPFAIFHDPAVLPSQLRFVKGGEVLAIQTAPGFDPDTMPDVMEPPRWQLLDRAGTLTSLDLGPFVYTIAGLHDGFAAWESNFETQTATLTRYRWDADPANAEISVIWTGDNPNWSLVWTVPQFTGDPGTRFPAIP